MAGYLTLPTGHALTAEIDVRRSRFLAVVCRVGDESAARAVIAGCRSAYPDARHHCSAFVLGPAPRTERSNDDGEPSGTAGAPMLQVLRSADLSDVVAVVTRYFGGTLLGTGAWPGPTPMRSTPRSIVTTAAFAACRSSCSSWSYRTPTPDGSKRHYEQRPWTGRICRCWRPGMRTRPSCTWRPAGSVPVSCRNWWPG
ncbi:IMPACT family protein [Branchiibius cervicis]|uniref:IMPACT family protein n=1 Tax=Branchiibius cervicis TaxID=908252 RepID=A0ABW2ASF3_9MICO